MSIDISKIETGLEHAASGFLSFMKAFLHIAVAAAPVASQVATATGHADVVGDIEKAGAAADAASHVVDNIG